MDGWNTTFLLGRPIFRCYVSFREGRITINRFLLHVRDLKGDTFKTFRHTSYGEKTPPKTNKCPLKINGWKMYFLLKWHLSRGHVSFRGCIHQSYLRLWHGKVYKKSGSHFVGNPSRRRKTRCPGLLCTPKGGAQRSVPWMNNTQLIRLKSCIC